MKRLIFKYALFTRVLKMIKNAGFPINSISGMTMIKNENNSYYYRARPELVQVLTNTGVDVITGANNHVGDYGPEAIFQQIDILEKAEIGFVGIGKNITQAKQFKVFKVNNVKVAIIGVDATQKTSLATSDSAGTFWLDEKDPDLFVQEIEKQVQLAKRLIREAKVDGILGHSAHVFQGIEIIDQKPVIYDAGNLMVDYNGNDWEHKSLLYKLYLNPDGVKGIELTPIRLYESQTKLAHNIEVKEILEQIQELSKPFSTKIVVDKEYAYVQLDPLKKEKSKLEIQTRGTLTHKNLDIEKPSIVNSKLPEDIIQKEVLFENGIKFF